MKDWQIAAIIEAARNVIDAYDGKDGKRIVPGDSRWIEDLRRALREAE